MLQSMQSIDSRFKPSEHHGTPQSCAAREQATSLSNINTSQAGSGSDRTDLLHPEWQAGDSRGRTGSSAPPVARARSLLGIKSQASGLNHLETAVTLHCTNGRCLTPDIVYNTTVLPDMGISLPSAYCRSCTSDLQFELKGLGQLERQYGSNNNNPFVIHGRRSSSAPPQSVFQQGASDNMSAMGMQGAASNWTPFFPEGSVEQRRDCFNSQNSTPFGSG